MKTPSKYDALRVMREREWAKRIEAWGVTKPDGNVTIVTRPGPPNVTRQGGRAKIYESAAAKQRAYRERKAKA